MSTRTPASAPPATEPAPPARPLPFSRRSKRFAEPLGWIALALAGIWLLTSASVFHTFLGGLVVIYAISALGLDWIQGRAGQVSIGNAAFMGIGAYVTATVAGWGWSMPAALLAAILAGALIGFIIGLPAMRLEHLYLALSTLALHFITQVAGLEYEARSGNDAGFPVPPPTIGPIDLRGKVMMGFLLILLVLAILMVRNLYRRAPGRAWVAIRESQMAASVIGVPVTQWKLKAFVASSAMISLTGGLLAYYILRVFNETFSLHFALAFLAMIIVGGLGSMVGAIIGAVLITIAPYAITNLTRGLPSDMPLAEWLNANIFYINNGLYGILLLAFLLYQPHGIMGWLQAVVRFIDTRVAKRTGAPVTEAAAPESVARLEVVERAEEVVDETVENAVLDIRGLSLTYRTGAVAVSDLTLHVAPGEIVALLGRNGAGKTSTLRAISGFFRSDRVRLTGSIRFEGEEILGESPIVTSRRGISMVPERDKMFKSLTVAEHFRLVGASEADRKQYEAIFPPLAQRAKSPAGLLSGGERQMLALAIAWCMHPKLLLIDELSLGLSPAATKALTASLREFRDRTHVPILVVEQNVSAALEIADRVYIMEAGKIVHTAKAQDASRETVLKWSFGTD